MSQCLAQEPPIPGLRLASKDGTARESLAGSIANDAADLSCRGNSEGFALLRVRVGWSACVVRRLERQPPATRSVLRKDTTWRPDSRQDRWTGSVSQKFSGQQGLSIRLGGTSRGCWPRAAFGPGEVQGHPWPI